MKHTILVIEDENSIRNDLTEILLFEGYTVLSADNGATGLQLAIEQLPDLILSDVMMPEMDGYELLSALSENPLTRLIPVILVSAMAETENWRAGMNKGAADYLIKPFTRNQLLDAIHSRLQKLEFVNEQRQADLQELRLQLIKYLPHELNTPLNGIIGIGQILKDYPESLSQSEIADFGSSIYESGMRLHRLIQNYLMYSELIVRHDTVTTSAPLENPGDLCQSILMSLAMKYNRSADTTLTIEPCNAIIGFREFSKVAEELIDNAFKFSKPETPISVRCECHENKFRMQIEDQGMGMTQEQIQRIGAYVQFNRNQQEQQGSGMGLSIAKMIVAMYGGEFTIESEPDKGTVVTVELLVP